MDTNIKYLVDNGINIWNKDAYNFSIDDKKEQSLENFIKGVKSGGMIGNLGRIYGAQWRKWNEGDWNNYEEGYDSIHDFKGINQISNLIEGLKKNPMSTQHIVTAWNPAELDDMALPPCHWSFEILVEPIHWKSRLNKLEELGATWESKTNINDVLKKWKIPEYKFTLKWHQRSVDTFLGLPFNIASYSLLSHIIGKLTNMIPKGIIGDLSNVHIYEPHIDAVKKQLNRDVDKYDGMKTKVVDFHDLKRHYDSEGLDSLLDDLDLSENFKLKNYDSYSPIKAEMFERDE